jgi:hypothetical protein
MIMMRATREQPISKRAKEGIASPTERSSSIKQSRGGRTGDLAQKLEA